MTGVEAVVLTVVCVVVAFVLTTGAVLTVQERKETGYRLRKELSAARSARDECKAAVSEKELLIGRLDGGDPRRDRLVEEQRMFCERYRILEREIVEIEVRIDEYNTEKRLKDT